MEYGKPEAYKPAKERLISIHLGLHQVLRLKASMVISYPTSSQQQKEWTTNPPLSIRDRQMEFSTVNSVVMGWIRYPLQSSTLPYYAFMETDPLTTTQPKHCTSYFKDCVPLVFLLLL